MTTLVLRLLSSPWLELFEALAQENVVLFLRLVELVALGPVVTDSVSENDPGGVEGTARDGLLHGLTRLQLGARILVPESPSAVGTHRRQSPVDRVERDVVDGIDVLDSLRKKNQQDTFKMRLESKNMSNSPCTVLVRKGKFCFF